jgi:hypothetical protein
MEYFAIVSLLFGGFTLWLTYDDWEYKRDPLGFSAWGHYAVTACMAVGSVATIATAVWALI